MRNSQAAISKGMMCVVQFAVSPHCATLGFAGLGNLSAYIISDDKNNGSQ